jgi:hypothetical protein
MPARLTSPELDLLRKLVNGEAVSQEHDGSSWTHHASCNTHLQCARMR